jgi:DNA-binding NtrC family response regulator
MGRKKMTLSEAARQALVAHSWPGNVRELQNCLERAVILCEGTQVGPEHLRLVGSGSGPTLADVMDLSGPLADVARRAAARAEEEAVRLAMAETQGDRPAAASRLGVSVSTLNRRLRQMGGGDAATCDAVGEVGGVPQT